MTPEEIERRLAEIPEAPWVREMREHYNREGYYRPEDLRRLLGDPCTGVEIGPRASLAEHFAEAPKDGK